MYKKNVSCPKCGGSNSGIIFRPYITKNGVRIYPKRSRYFPIHVGLCSCV